MKKNKFEIERTVRRVSKEGAAILPLTVCFGATSAHCVHTLVRGRTFAADGVL